MPMFQDASQWEICFLGIVQGRGFSSDVFLQSLGVASWVEKDVERLLGACWTTRGAGVSVREMGICHCVEKNSAVPGQKLLNNI